MCLNSCKVSRLQNLCNQGNMAKTNESCLSQHNYLVMIGFEHINSNTRDKNHIPITVNISKNGELQISGLDESIVSEDNLCIYTDKKVTRSKG